MDRAEAPGRLAGMISKAILRARHAGGVVGEFVFVTAALFGGMTGALILLGGINPFSSPAFVGVLAFALLAGLIHHLWFVRRRAEIEHSAFHHAERERRGY